MLDNMAVKSWIDEMTKLLKPKEVVLIDGSKEQFDGQSNRHKRQVR
jgi:GTP-dependent phosphoenolpyruvate carboxykinase